jgi:hypothetical protein
LPETRGGCNFLARISHQLSAATADAPRTHWPTT